MKKLLILGVVIGTASLVQASSINISIPQSLNGYYAYSLGVQTGIPDDQQVTSMTISFDNVHLTSAPTGYLYVDLLDSSASGINTYFDNDAPGDYFASTLAAGEGTALGTQQFRYSNETLSWSYTLNSDQLAALNAYLSNGEFDIGLDPDCWFNWGYGGGSCKVIWNSCTKPHNQNVPDTAVTAGLLGMSFLGLLAFRRRLAAN